MVKMPPPKCKVPRHISAFDNNVLANVVHMKVLAEGKSEHRIVALFIYGWNHIFPLSSF